MRLRKSKKIRVLLVDDEEEFVRTLSERLKLRDIDSAAVYNGEQAMEFVSEEEPEVLVLDLKMPGIHGIEVLRWIKEFHPSVQVIILTGHGTELDERKARELGAFEYMKKPVETDSLLSKIRAAYKLHFEDAMSAVAFAESGEFNTADAMWQEGRPAPGGGQQGVQGSRQNRPDIREVPGNVHSLRDRKRGRGRKRKPGP